MPLPEPPKFDPIPQRPKAAQSGSALSPMGKAYGIAFEFGVYLIVCAGVGWLADRYLVGSGQTWTVTGALFGMLGGGIRTVRATLRLYKEMDQPSPPAT